MKIHIRELITQAIVDMQEAGAIARDIRVDIQIDRTRDKIHGDLACNLDARQARTAQASRAGARHRAISAELR